MTTIRTRKTMTYEYTDKVIKYINKRLIDLFGKLRSIANFDQLNVLQAVNDTYEEADRVIRKAYLRLARNTYRNRKIDEDWIDFILTAYDPVSKYVYANEFDRKRARLIEALISSPTKAKEVDAAMRALSVQARIYAVTVTDKAHLQELEDNRVIKVQWIAEKDEKTCTVCHKRDGKIYLLKDLPPKPHPNCRCWLKEVFSGR